MNISDMILTTLKSLLHIFRVHSEGPVSQISDIGPSFYFMVCSNLCPENLEKVTCFLA